MFNLDIFSHACTTLISATLPRPITIGIDAEYHVTGVPNGHSLKKALCSSERGRPAIGLATPRYRSLVSVLHRGSTLPHRRLSDRPYPSFPRSALALSCAPS